jgi:glycosyltransferase involved in cell wall biosynthesis
MKKPLASFVIPVHNGQAYLAETLDSCLNQKENKIDIVVVNDGSDDGTQKIIDFFCKKDSRIIPIRLANNIGRSEARNTGIRAATTDILMMMDADDIAMPNRASDTISFFKRNPGIDITYGNFILMNEAGLRMANDAGAPLGPVGGDMFSYKRVKETGFTYIGHSTMSFRRRVVDKINYTNGDYCKNAIDDWKFQIDAYKKKFKFAPIPKNILCHYRVIHKERDEQKIKELKDACLN